VIVGSAEVQLRSTSDKLAGDFRADLQAASSIFDSEGRQLGTSFADQFSAAARLDSSTFKQDLAAVTADAGVEGRAGGTEFSTGFEQTSLLDPVDVRSVADGADQAGREAGTDFSTGFTAASDLDVPDWGTPAAGARPAGTSAGREFSSGFEGASDLPKVDTDGVAPGAGGSGSGAGRKFREGFEDEAKPDGGGLLDAFKDLGGKAGAGLLAGFAAVGVGAGIAGIISESVAGAIDMSAANDKLAAQLGANEETSRQLGEVAGRVYAGAYGDSLDEVNEAIRLVTQNIGQMSGGALESTTETVLNLASAFDVDLVDATANAGQLIKTGLAANSTEAFDIITAGFQGGINKADDFMQVLEEYSTQFRKVGIDGQTALGLMSQGLQAGARDADIVADAIKEFSIRSIDGSTLTAEGFKALGLSADDMAAKIIKGGPSASAALDLTLDSLRAFKDPVEASRIAVALFGTQAEDLGAALYALDVSTAADTIGQVGGAAERMGTTLNDNAASNLESFKRQVQQTFVEVVGGQALPAIEEAASFLATGFGPAVDAMKASLASAGEGGGPFGPLVAGAREFLDDIVPGLQEVAGPLQEFGAALLEPLKEAGAEVFAVLGPALGDIGEVIGSDLLPALAEILPIVQPIAAFFLDVFLGAVVGAIKGVVNVLEGVIKIITGVVQVVAGIFTGDWRQAWDGLKNIASGALDALIGVIQVFLNVGLLRAFKLGVTALASLWDEGLALVPKIGKGALDLTGTVISAGLSAVVSFFKAAPGRILGALGDLGGLLSGLTSRALSAMGSAASGGISTVLGFFRALPGRILSALGSLGGMLLQAGRDIIQGLINGVRGRIGEVTGMIAGLAAQVKDAFTSALHIESPSRVFHGYGVHIVDGLVNGIKARQPAAVAIVEDLAKAVATKYSAAIDTLDKALEDRRNYSASLKEAAVGGADLFADQNLNATQIAQSLRDQILKVQQFNGILGQLKTAGLSDALYRQVAGLGADKGIAVGVRILADPGSAKELSALQGLLTEQAEKLGNSAGHELYDAGVYAAEGLVAGIKSRRQALLDAAAEMGKTMAKAVRDELRIKSPSGVFADIGDEIPAGLAAGIDRSTPLVTDASSRMTAASLIRPSTAQLAALAQSQGMATLSALGVQQQVSEGRTNIYQIDATNMTPAELERELRAHDQLDDLLHPSVGV
jgi:phage-related minor tail protein